MIAQSASPLSGHLSVAAHMVAIHLCPSRSGQPLCSVWPRSMEVSAGSSLYPKKSTAAEARRRRAHAQRNASARGAERSGTCASSCHNVLCAACCGRHGALCRGFGTTLSPERVKRVKPPLSAT